MADELSDFDGAHFRAVLGHFPTGVTIVTALADGLRGPGTQSGLHGPGTESGLRGPGTESGLRGPGTESGLRGPGTESGLRGPGTESRRPIGFTVGSFTSISLDPPLVGFLAMHDSETWMAMAKTTGFCVNVLCNTQAALCWRFARRGNEDSRFDGLAWKPAPATGSPVIDGVTAWIDCAIERTIVLGDHELVVGAVRALDHHTEAHAPLVFYKGALGGFAADD